MPTPGIAPPGLSRNNYSQIQQGKGVRKPSAATVAFGSKPATSGLRPGANALALYEYAADAAAAAQGVYE